MMIQELSHPSHRVPMPPPHATYLRPGTATAPINASGTRIIPPAPAIPARESVMPRRVVRPAAPINAVPRNMPSTGPATGTIRGGSGTAPARTPNAGPQPLSDPFQDEQTSANYPMPVRRTHYTQPSIRRR